jgi:hypothetical protein
VLRLELGLHQDAYVLLDFADVVVAAAKALAAGIARHTRRIGAEGRSA